MRQKNAWTVLRALFARSGNRCSFAGCSHELINEDGLFVGEVCHIRAAEPGGPRYDPKQTAASRRTERNLVLLCHAHHVVIDSNLKVHTVRTIERMKRRHEVRQRATFRVERRVLQKLAADVNAYWARVASLHAKARRSGAPVVALGLRRRPHALIRAMKGLIANLEAAVGKISHDADDIPSQVRKVLSRVGLPTGPWDDLPYYKNPLCRWNWEYLNLAFPNSLLNMLTAVVQLDIRLAEEDHLQNPNSGRARRRLTRARREFEEIASKPVYYD